MTTQEKIRLAITTIIKDIVFFVIGIIIMFVIVSISVLAETTKSTESNETKAIMSKKETANVTETVNRIEEPIENISTMQLMIERKEVAKGDFVEKLNRKAERKRKRRKKREAERKRKEAERKNWLQSLYTQENVGILAHVMEGEAGDQSDACQQSVGQVVLNRVKSEEFKQNTIKTVVFAPGQYACTWDGNYDKKPSERAYKNAKAVLTGNVCIKVPENVVYQSQFRQGSGIWQKIGTETFCFG